ncbi:hypothetical protein [Streptomyces lydicus]|uniref:hypothetical protein n=1 Tax=Streptomyces lydicus TaxID=47763 RepID=UPI002870A1C4|nr:hypothetical protein [Streptomyces lydicus]
MKKGPAAVGAVVAGLLAPLALATPAHADSSHKAFCNTTGGHGCVTAPSYTGSTDSV